MVKVRTFKKGGIHPNGNKNISLANEFKNSLIVKNAIIPMAQHLGIPAECCINVGDKISEGTLLGKSSGIISANVHSPFSGVVSKISNIYLPSGVFSPAVFIDVEGDFTDFKSKKINKNWGDLPKQKILQLVKDNGVVGLGGATFPSDVKLIVPRGKKAEYLIINGAECEPYLTSDHTLMLNYGDEMLEGVKIIQHLTEADNVAIGIETNKMECIELLEKKIAEKNLNIKIYPLKQRYPQGDEKILINVITGREVLSGTLPIDIGCIVCNVGTAKAVYDAVVLERPLIDRIVTVTGGALSAPCNLKTRIGVPIKVLLEECGVDYSKLEKIVAGGPMMGFSVVDLDTPVTKGTSGILALTKKEATKKRETNCLSCGRCLTVCPIKLNPTFIYKCIESQNYQKAVDVGLLDCKECGCCSYICPAGIYLVQGFKLGKKIFRINK